jgi:hypothetical protein
MIKNIIIITLSLFFLIQLGLNLYLLRGIEVPKIHILERPLKIYSFEGKYSQNSTLPEYSILPEGTVLYDDSDSLNRRVKVYFNLQGVDFNFEEQSPDILKQPSELSAIRSDDLSDMAKSVSLIQKDIYLIIKNDETIKDPVRLALFKKYKIDPSEYEVN